MKKSVLILAVAALAVQGCANNSGKSASSMAKKQTKEVVDGTTTRNLAIGKTYSKIPPILVREEVSWGQNRPSQTVAWDDTELFGPVPKHLVQEGIKTCQAVGGSQAKGYHPYANGVNGKPIPGGGFLCF